MLKNIIRPIYKDINLLIIEAILIFIGVVMIYSASYYSAIDTYSDGAYYLKKQMIFLVLAIIGALILHKIPLKMLIYFAIPGYILSIVLLLVVAFTNVNNAVNGAKRWLTIAGVQFQPSELAKVILIIIAAFIIVKYKYKLASFKGIVIYSLIMLIPIALTLKENFSTAFLMACIIYGIYFLGVPKGLPYLLIIAMIGAVGVGLIAFSPGKESFRSLRMEVYLNGPEVDPTGFGYQVIHARDAIGSGGVFGLGLGRSMEKVDFLPEAHNDIIFAIICEEIGFVGGMIVVLLLLMLIYRGISIARTIKDPLASLIVFGVSIHIGLQAFVNMGVATATIPVTGMTLPFISYGGTSLVLFIGELAFIQRAFHENKISQIKQRKLKESTQEV